MTKNCIRLLSALLALVLLLSLAAGCGAKGENVPDPAPGQEGADPTPGEDGKPYHLDRNNVDLSAYDLPEMGADLPFGRIITDEEFESEPTANEVRVQMSDYNPRKKAVRAIHSDRYAFRFAELPPYDEAKEAEYTFDGSRVRFVFHIENSNEPWVGFIGRNVTDAMEHAFVIRAVAQTDYIPYKAADQKESLIIRLVVCIDNDSGEKDTFLIDEDYRILHFEGEYGDDNYFTTAGEITDISVEPIPQEWALYLEAMAARYVYDTRYTSADMLNIYRFRDANEEGLDDAIAKAFERAEIRLEYDGRTRIMDDAEAFDALARILEGDTQERFARDFFWSAEGDTAYRDGAVHITVTDKTEENRGVMADVYISPDGTAWVRTPRMSVETCDRGSPQLFVTFRADFVYHSLETYPFDEIVAFVG